MPEDIRDILKQQPLESVQLSSDHRQKFEARLRAPKKSKSKAFIFLKIAAGLLVLISLGLYFSQGSISENPVEQVQSQSLAAISPEMQQIENYYLTAINYELASIETDEANQEILATYLEKIAILTKQYRALNLELQQNGVNEKTINALIDNLQLRLQILLELKDIINELKTPKNVHNEKNTI